MSYPPPPSPSRLLEEKIPSVTLFSLQEEITDQLQKQRELITDLSMNLETVRIFEPVALQKEDVDLDLPDTLNAYRNTLISIKASNEQLSRLIRELRIS